MTESAADIIKYLDIVDGKKLNEDVSEMNDIDLGISTRGADVGNSYLFDNGSCWARIIKEEDNHWLIEHGLLEHEATDKSYISKYDMTDMIKLGEMILSKLDEETDILEESLNPDSYFFQEFLTKVDRFLLVNEEKEVGNYEYDWNDAYQRGLSPIEAIDEAIILEG